MNVIAAETDGEAQRLFTSLRQAFAALRSGRPGPLPRPVGDMPPAERIGPFRYAVVGGPEMVRRGLEEVVAQTQADEVMVTASIHDHAARVRSFEITADVWREALALAAE